MSPDEHTHFLTRKQIYFLMCPFWIEGGFRINGHVRFVDEVGVVAGKYSVFNKCGFFFNKLKSSAVNPSSSGIAGFKAGPILALDKTLGKKPNDKSADKE